MAVGHSRPVRALQRGKRVQLIDKESILRRDARFNDSRPAKKGRAESTKENLAKVMVSWERYCQIMYPERKPLEVLQNAGVEDFRRYIDYCLTNGNYTSQGAIWTRWKFLLCLYQDETGREVEMLVRREMHGLLHGHFVDEFDLSRTPREKPVMSVEDLLLVIHYLWVSDGCVFPVERQRVQLATLMLLTAYTSSRPGALVEASCAPGSNECITYNDIRILVIRNPEESMRNVVVMEITFRYTKGNRQTKKPITYLFHEREDNLALCPILHIFSLAVADNAFRASNIQGPEDIYGVEIPACRESLQVQWKQSVLDIPVFRRSIRTRDGVVTSPTRALSYDTFVKYLKDLGRAAGFRQLLTPYCLRRGAANAVNGVATEAERNQALGHSRSEIFLRYYIQQQVRADVQSAFLGVPARQALFKAVGRMSLDRDPRVPQSLDAAQRADVKRDPRLVSLVCERADLRKQLIRDHGMIKDGVGTSTYVKYRAAQRDHRNMEIALLEDKLKVVKDAFFQSIDTREIEAQLRPRDKEIRSDGELLAAALAAPPSYTFDERARLALALFENTSAADDALTNRTRRCAAIEDMANLTFKIQTPRLDKERVWTDIADIIAEELEPLCVQDEPDLYPKVCPSTVCLFCLGNENMTSISRIHSYARKDSLSRHVKVSHLRYIDPLADISCPHPACDSVCKGHNGFKAHAGRAHNVWHA